MTATEATLRSEAREGNGAGRHLSNTSASILTMLAYQAGALMCRALHCHTIAASSAVALAVDKEHRERRSCSSTCFADIDRADILGVEQTVTSDLY